MSSRINGSSLSSFKTGGGGGKKKFGKNLNKQLEAPAPPIAQPGTAKTRSSSGNGLLLLSTKRSSSTGGLLAKSKCSTSAPNAPAGYNLHSNGTKPSSPLDSVENPLVSQPPLQVPSSVTAVTTTRTTESSFSSAHEALLDAVNGKSASRNSDAQRQPDAWRLGSEESLHDGDLKKYNTVDEPKEPLLAPQRGVAPAATRREPVEFVAEISYPVPERVIVDTSREPYDQPAFMAKLAREKKEKIRSEELARQDEQRSGATRRLKDLEDKMASTAVHQSISPPQMSVDMPHGHRGTSTTMRTLFDPNPNPTFSPLLAGKKSGPEARENVTEVAPRMNGANLNESPNGLKAASPTEMQKDVMPEGPVIQLSSYEDRDRGERNGAGGPRMLFDPKSGSMVAVKPGRQESGGNAKGRKAKASVAKKEPTGDENSRFNGNASNGRKGKTPRKDSDPAPRRDGRKRGDSTDSKEENAKTGRNPRASKIRSAEKRLPRTLGVLYVRDEKGNCYCADGCEGDQGYGCHGVPGGRMRNPAAYAKFLDDQQKLTYSMEVNGYSADDQGGQADSSEYGTSQDESYPPKQVKHFDWVKSDDKIELLTGAPESPTLQATARPWAPTGAALALAANGLGKPKSPETTPPRPTTTATTANGIHVDHSPDDADLDSDPASFIGLGFDPTKDMDSVMQSPAYVTERRTFDPAGLAALTLDSKVEGATPKNIFAFGTDTWGAGSGAGGSTWSSPGNDTCSAPWGGVLGSKQKADGKGTATSPFLSLTATSGSTWGGNIPGLTGGAALPGGGATAAD